MVEYLVSKQDEHYVVYRDRVRINPEVNYDSFMQVFAAIIYHEENIEDIIVRLGSQVSSEKDAQAMRIALKRMQAYERRVRLLENK